MPLLSETMSSVLAKRLTGNGVSEMNRFVSTGTKTLLEIISTLLRRIGIPPPRVAPWRVSLYKDRGSQIGGWVFSSLDHVIRGGPKYTISLPSGRGMSVD